MLNKKRAPRKRKTGNPKPSKALTRAVKQVVQKNVETKVINVPDSVALTTNTVHRPVTANAGLVYLTSDIFRVTQGVQDGNAIGSANRIGDRVKGVGFLMDYFFTLNTSFNLAGNAYIIPYVKVRVIVWRQAFGSPLLPAPLLLDSNYLALSGPTLRPINWDEGYIKDVLYDKIHMVRTQAQTSTLGTGTLINAPFNSAYHFKKYIKFPHVIKYCDNNSTSPNSTQVPIYMAITAECDEGTAFVPSSANLLYVTGYTKAWFKDA